MEDNERKVDAAPQDAAQTGAPEPEQEAAVR